MSLFVIPVDPANASQIFRVGLDGVNYWMRFDFNATASLNLPPNAAAANAGRWSVSLYSDGGTPVYLGRLLTVGQNPFGGLTNPAAPPGLFMCISATASVSTDGKNTITGDDNPPGYYGQADLGTGYRCQLLYQGAY